jgi:formyltetrahydrofolate deformylase
VTHSHTPQQLVALGQDVECRVLARAVAWHIERRIMISGSKTIVFA